jgi:F-type H+-transporting ATPase subunit b
MLTKARTEADKIFQDGKKEADNKKILMLEETKDEVATLIENGKKTLEIEKTRMVEEAKNEIVNLAMLATRKLIESKQDLGNF